MRSRKFWLLLVFSLAGSGLAACISGTDGAACEGGISAADDIVGQWRSVNSWSWWRSSAAPGAWEIEFKTDGHYAETIDNGSAIAREYEASYRIAGSDVLLERSWRYRPLRLAAQRNGEELVLCNRGEGGWRTTFEQSNEPHPALVDMPREPKTVQQAVSLLMLLIDSEDLDSLRALDEDELPGLHMGLGMYIRNTFGMWGGNYALVKDSSPDRPHPDYASAIIIRALWSSLQTAKPSDASEPSGSQTAKIMP